MPQKKSAMTIQENDPGLMSLEDYLESQNKRHIRHPSDSYDFDLADMNQDYKDWAMGSNKDFKLHQRMNGWTILKDDELIGVSDGHTLWVAHQYLNQIPEYFYGGPAHEAVDVKLGNPVAVKYPAEYLSRVFNVQQHTKATYPVLLQQMGRYELRATKQPETNQGVNLALCHDGLVVAVAQNEWGATLIVVAQEYRHRGLGPLMHKYWAQYNPEFKSGGYTWEGEQMAIRAWANRVRELASHGIYTKLIQEGKMTAEKAKALIQEAVTKSGHPANLEDPQEERPHLLLHNIDNIGFTLYDSRFIEHQDENYIKAHGFMRGSQEHEFYYALDYEPAYRKMANAIALQLARDTDVQLHMDGPSDLLEPEGLPVKQEGDRIELTQDVIDLQPLFAYEHQLLTSQDPYGQIGDLLLGMAESKSWGKAKLGSIDKTAAPEPLEVHKRQVYYHGIDKCDDALAEKILQEGLTIDPKRGERWGVHLQPQKAVYLTTDLGIALGYATGRGSSIDLMEHAGKLAENLYVAEVSGKVLQANIEIDEDHLDDIFDGNDDFSWLPEPTAKWFQQQAEAGFSSTKDLIKQMPSQVAYDLIETFPNLAHYTTTPVKCIYKWEQGDRTPDEFLDDLQLIANSGGVPVGMSKVFRPQGQKAAKSYSMPLDEAVQEHERLVKVLKSPSHKDDLEEAKEQGAELARMKQAALPKTARPEQVSTPAFRSWFGQSKVVDQDGNPLPVYHATDTHFHVFDHGQAGRNTNDEGAYVEWSKVGFHFTDNLQYAEDHASGLESGAIMLTYLRIEHPYELTDTDWHRALQDMESGETDAEDYVDMLKGDGYDGIIMEVRDNGVCSTHYIVFDPNQIKSAIGNNGDFDTSNPSIIASATPTVFPSSKVRDPQGNLILCYHGSDKTFDQFDIPEHGVAYFTPSPDYGYVKRSPQGYQCYLDIQNPYWADSVSDAEGAGSWPTWIQELKQQGHDGIIYADPKNLTKGPSGWGDDWPQFIVFSPKQVHMVERSQKISEQHKWQAPSFEQMAWLGCSRKAYNRAKARLEGLQFPLTIYRAARLSDEQALRTQGVGVYWTEQLSRARLYTPAGRNAQGDTFVLRAQVTAKDVDWDSTFSANLEPYGNTGVREQEIRLNFGVHLRINGIKREKESDFRATTIHATASKTSKRSLGAVVRSVAISHEAYKILGNHADDFMTGGCWAFAEALHRNLPGSSLKALVDETGQVEHVMVGYSGMLYDAEGVWTPTSRCRTFEDEFKRPVTVSTFHADQAGEVECPASVVAGLSKLFAQALGRKVQAAGIKLPMEKVEAFISSAKAAIIKYLKQVQARYDGSTQIQDAKQLPIAWAPGSFQSTLPHFIRVTGFSANPVEPDSSLYVEDQVHLTLGTTQDSGHVIVAGEMSTSKEQQSLKLTEKPYSKRGSMTLCLAPDVTLAEAIRKLQKDPEEQKHLRAIIVHEITHAFQYLSMDIKPIPSYMHPTGEPFVGPDGRTMQYYTRDDAAYRNDPKEQEALKNQLIDRCSSYFRRKNKRHVTEQDIKALLATDPVWRAWEEDLTLENKQEIYKEVYQALSQAKSRLLQASPLPVTDSPQFKAWFGNSKVVDDEGNPLPVYHGALRSFNRFDINKAHKDTFFGPGFYFSGSPADVARNYSTPEGPDHLQNLENIAENIQYDLEQDPDYEGLSDKELGEKAMEMAKKDYAGGGELAPQTFKVYLKMEKPAYWDGPRPTRIPVNMRLIQQLGPLGGWDSRGWADFLYDYVGEEIPIPTLFKKLQDACLNLEDDEGNPTSCGAVIAKILRAKGYDGIIMLEPHKQFKRMNFKGDVHYIVWKPSQIKSAIGNSGRFNPKSPLLVASPNSMRAN